ncbi:hypothetical protein YC2023_018137 [Brassica napus]
MKTLKWREFEAKPKPEAKEERQIQRTGLWYGLDRWGETRLRWERTSSRVGKTKIDKMVGVIRNEHGPVRIMGNQCYCRATVRDDPAIIQLKPIVEALRRTLKGTVVDSLEAGRELSRTGSKHDGIEVRRENPKLGENPNFGIMEFFEEAGGSEKYFYRISEFI